MALPEPVPDPICPLCSKPLSPGQSAAMHRGQIVHVRCWCEAARLEAMDTRDQIHGGPGGHGETRTQSRALREALEKNIAEHERALQERRDILRKETENPDPEPLAP